MEGGGELTDTSLKRMADTMTHRGPDDSGTYINHDHHLGFGFRRLSIIDLEGGHQPMSNEDGTIWIVFNGEIYNHYDLRKELEALGHIYSSRADTESIIHAYEEWGEDCVDRLRGMFAFAIWDVNKRKLFLARDRMGIKPLYYTEQNGCLIFASEIKAILAWPGIKKEVDNEALYNYLTLLVTPSPMTMFQGIYKLPPGHILTISDNNNKSMYRYWEPIIHDNGLEGIDETEVVDRLRELLRESIRLRMMSDVPFGVFLSGGVDSSLNVALMSEFMDRPVDTFSVSIKDDTRSDELKHARAVAEHFGTNHHEVEITSQDFINFLPQMAYFQDEPLSDPVCVPLYYVSRLARQNGTIVIQVGEGSDELFGGYTAYTQSLNFEHRYFHPFASLPLLLKKPIAALGKIVLPLRRAEYLRKAAQNEPFFWSSATALTELEKRSLLRNGQWDNKSTLTVVNKWYQQFQRGHPDNNSLDRMIYIELQHRLPELLLMRVDKMAMASSIEARVPYLDHELALFTLAIPPVLKIRNGQTKAILKKAARGIIPDYVIDRPKHGFCGSADNMISGAVVDYAEKAVFSSDWFREWFNLERLREMFARHRSGRVDNGMNIWLLMNLALWHKHWIEGVSVEV